MLKYIINIQLLHKFMDVIPGILWLYDREIVSELGTLAQCENQLRVATARSRYSNSAVTLTVRYELKLLYYSIQLFLKAQHRVFSKVSSKG